MFCFWRPCRHSSLLPGCGDGGDGGGSGGDWWWLVVVGGGGVFCRLQLDGIVRASCGQSERGRLAFFVLFVFVFVFFERGLIEVKRVYTHKKSTFRERGVSGAGFCAFFFWRFFPLVFLFVAGEYPTDRRTPAILAEEASRAWNVFSWRSNRIVRSTRLF